MRSKERQGPTQIIIIRIIIIITIITKIIIILLFTLSGIYSTNASGAEQMPETNNSNQN